LIEPALIRKGAALAMESRGTGNKQPGCREQKVMLIFHIVPREQKIRVRSFNKLFERSAHQTTFPSCRVPFYYRQTMSMSPHPSSGADTLATRASLLGRLRNWNDSDSWEEFTETYSRLIRGVAIKSGLTETEARDVEQETLLCVAKTIHEFESNPNRGTFKSWLLNLTRWRIADQFRKRERGVPTVSSEATSTGTATIERLPGADNVEATWDAEWQKNILDTALARVGRRVKPKHLQIFDLYALRRWPAGKVARELGVSRVQVYLVHHRLTKQVKSEIEYLSRRHE